VADLEQRVAVAPRHASAAELVRVHPFLEAPFQASPFPASPFQALAFVARRRPHYSGVEAWQHYSFAGRHQEAVAVGGRTLRFRWM
jgi:hypothetical protein